MEVATVGERSVIGPLPGKQSVIDDDALVCDICGQTMMIEEGYAFHLTAQGKMDTVADQLHVPKNQAADDEITIDI